MSTKGEPPVHHGSLQIYDNLDQLTRAAADLVAQQSVLARPRGVFRVALSGGSTPRPVFQLLATTPYRERIDWSQVQFYWGDERNVGPDSPESNYRMAKEALLDHVPVAPEQVHRMRGELAAAEAAAEYEQVLARTFALAPGAFPRFDLILLGMGPDGHTASLFPYTSALAIRDRTVVANAVPKLQAERITLTAPTLNAAANVVFLIAGADKADALAAVLQGPAQPEEYPSQLIAPTNGTLTWMVDRAAAAKLSGV
jgi:6-phosphogluconolactonase